MSKPKPELLVRLPRAARRNSPGRAVRAATAPAPENLPSERPLSVPLERLESLVDDCHGTADRMDSAGRREVAQIVDSLVSDLEALIFEAKREANLRALEKALHRRGA